MLVTGENELTLLCRNGNDSEFKQPTRARTSSQSEKQNPKKKSNDDTVENRFAALTVQGEEDDE